MPKTATVHVQIQAELKEEAEALFKKLGLTSSEAISLFYKQVTLHKALPFSESQPNQQTRQTFTETDAGEHLNECKDADDMFEKLGI